MPVLLMNDPWPAAEPVGFSERFAFLWQQRLDRRSMSPAARARRQDVIDQLDETAVLECPESSWLHRQRTGLAFKWEGAGEDGAVPHFVEGSIAYYLMRVRTLALVSLWDEWLLCDWPQQSDGSLESWKLCALRVELQREFDRCVDGIRCAPAPGHDVQGMSGAAWQHHATVRGLALTEYTRPIALTKAEHHARRREFDRTIGEWIQLVRNAVALRPRTVGAATSSAGPATSPVERTFASASKAATTPVAKAPAPRKRGMPKEDANAQAAEFIPDFIGSHRRLPKVQEVVDAIGCAYGAVSALPAWKAANAQWKRAHPEAPARPPHVSLSHLEGSLGQDPDEVLKAAVDEQEADFEPSPLEADPPDAGRGGSPRRAKVFAGRRKPRAS